MYFLTKLTTVEKFHDILAEFLFIIRLGDGILLNYDQANRPVTCLKKYFSSMISSTACLSWSVSTINRVLSAPGRTNVFARLHAARR